MSDNGKSSKKVGLDIVQELLKVQESSFKALVSTLITDFNERFDKLTKVVCDLKHSLEYSQRDIEDGKTKLQCIDTIETQIESIKYELSEMADKADYLENQSRRNNIRISGVSEEASESWQATEDKVKAVLKTKLNIDPNKTEIERAHRTGKQSNGKPRHIVVKLLRYKDKERIMRSSKALKGTGIFINEDFSNRVMTRRKEQQAQMMQARQEGKIAYFNVDRLVVKDPRPMYHHGFASGFTFGAAASKQREFEVQQHNENEAIITTS